MSQLLKIFGESFKSLSGYIHISLTSTLDGSEWTASCTGRLNSGKVVTCTHWIRGWLGPIASVIVVGRRKIPSAARNRTCTSTWKLFEPSLIITVAKTYISATLYLITSFCCHLESQHFQCCVPVVFHKHEEEIDPRDMNITFRFMTRSCRLRNLFYT
jgi:hypothetical protein